MPPAKAAKQHGGGSSAAPAPGSSLLRVLPNFVVRPDRWTVFVGFLCLYFLVMGGSVYDLVNKPPAIGQNVDPRTGAAKPAVIMQGRINGQYMIEGLSASFLFIVGGGGLILLDRVDMEKSTTKTTRYMLMGVGVVAIFIAYNLVNVFMRFKIPGIYTPKVY